MIRYELTPTDLTAAINAIDSEWYTTAATTLAGLPPNPTSKQFVTLWSTIKKVWIKLQASKCVYCESLIEGNVSNDVEHFRPKAKVSVWKVPKSLSNEGVSVTPAATPKGDPGYRSLAYDPWNYAASCKVCNSILKKNLFPVAGPRNALSADPRNMATEKPLFVYPIGDFDANPQDLIRFAGIHPEPAVAKGSDEYRRALTMIEIFQLNNAEKRKELFQSRALLMKPLFDSLESARVGGSADVRQDARDWVRIFTDNRSPHASCMQSFKSIYETNMDRARQLLGSAKTFLQTGSVPHA